MPVLRPGPPQPPQQQGRRHRRNQDPGPGLTPIDTGRVEAEVPDLDHVRCADHVALVDDHLARFDGVDDGGLACSCHRSSLGGQGVAVGGVRDDERRREGHGEALLRRREPDIGGHVLAHEVDLGGRIGLADLDLLGLPERALGSLLHDRPSSGVHGQEGRPVAGREGRQHGLERGLSSRLRRRGVEYVVYRQETEPELVDLGGGLD